MKCNNCCALRTEGYEYPKSYCLLGGESTQRFADGWGGCYRKPESVKRQVDEIEDQMSHQHEDIDDSWVCVNDQSDYCTFPTEYEDGCEEWEDKR